MLGLENCLSNTDPRGDMMSGPGPCIPMGSLPPNYGMPRGGEGMYQGMVPSWPTPPGSYGGHLPPEHQHHPHGLTPDMGMHHIPPEKYELPPVSPPPQRERFSYTRYQLELLNSIYVSIRYPNSMQKQLIAKRVGITRDQVKIWFQNRRRKDVVGKNNPGKAPPPPQEDPHKPKMVPDQVMESVITELLKYENDPKGKKIKEAMERSKRSTQAHKRQKTGSSPESDGSRVSPGVVEDLLESPKYQPQGAFPVTSEGYIGNLGNPYTGMGGGLEKSPVSGGDSYTSAGESPESSLPSPPQEQRPRAEDPVPTSEQLDMVAPPNTVVPNCYIPQGIKRSHSNESLEDISDAEEDDVTSPVVVVQKRKTVTSPPPPPNQVAPPSEPIKFSVNSAFTPTKPLAVHIPHSVMRGSDTTTTTTTVQSEHAHDYSQMTSLPHPLHWGVAEGQLVRDPPQGQYGEQGVDPQAYFMGPPPPDNRPGENGDPRGSDPKSLNVNSVFPFPLMAEPPRMMSSMASYPEHYAHAHTMAAGGYQPMMISSFNNPYYAGYDASAWPGYQDNKQQMAKN